jgi:hypothetical protein
MMSMVEIRDTEHGVVLSSADAELVDLLEDFLTEKCFVEFSVKFEPERSSLLFGEASSVSKVEALYERFMASEMTKAT